MPKNTASQLAQQVPLCASWCGFVQKPKAKHRVFVALGWNDPRLMLGIEKHARRAGWHLETRHFFDRILPPSWQGDGLILSCISRPDLFAFARKHLSQQPMVLVGENNPGLPIPQVAEDNHAAGVLVARHFIEQGHKHYAWLNPYVGQVGDSRLAGYRSTLNKAGFDCHIIKARPGRRLDSRRLLDQFRALPQPLACYILDDQLASEMIGICLFHGLRVPEDIAIIGTGNIGIACECSHVPVSSVDLADEEIGQTAAELLDRLMHGAKPPAQPVFVPPRGLVVRKSSDFLSLTDPILRKAVDHITENLHRLLSLEQIAAAAGISRRTLYNVFQRELRITPAEFIAKTRVSHAKQLLAKPDQTVTATAAQCGFASPRALARLFARKEGSSISSWKRKQQNTFGK